MPNLFEYFIPVEQFRSYDSDGTIENLIKLRIEPKNWLPRIFSKFYTITVDVAVTDRSTFILSLWQKDHFKLEAQDQIKVDFEKDNFIAFKVYYHEETQTVTALLVSENDNGDEDLALKWKMSNPAQIRQIKSKNKFDAQVRVS